MLTVILVATHTDTQTHRHTDKHTNNASYKEMTPLCTRICPYPFFEVTPPGAAPGPPVKTGARVRRFRGCKYVLDAQSAAALTLKVSVGLQLVGACGMVMAPVQKAMATERWRGFDQEELRRRGFEDDVDTMVVTTMMMVAMTMMRTVAR